MDFGGAIRPKHPTRYAFLNHFCHSLGEHAPENRYAGRKGLVDYQSPLVCKCRKDKEIALPVDKRKSIVLNVAETLQGNVSRDNQPSGLLAKRTVSCKPKLYHPFAPRFGPGRKRIKKLQHSFKGYQGAHVQ